MICCTDNTAEVRVPIKHILSSSALLKNNLLQKQKSTFCLSKVTCVSDKTTTLMRSWRNMCKSTIFLMVDNVSPQQSLWWEIVFFVQKICYNLTVSVTLYYTLANFDPYRFPILYSNLNGFAINSLMPHPYLIGRMSRWSNPIRTVS